MATPTGPIRRQLWRHFRASGHLLRLMTAPAELLPGSFYLLRRKCGKPSCRCAQGHLHATWVLTRSEAGQHTYQARAVNSKNISITEIFTFRLLALRAGTPA